MKQLTGLSEQIKDFRGRILTNDFGAPWTVAEVIALILSQARVQGPDTFVIKKLGEDMVSLNGNDSMQVEDHPYTLLMKEVKPFPNLTVTMRAPLEEWIEKMESAKPEDNGNVSSED